MQVVRAIRGKKKKRLVVNEYIFLKLRSTQHIQQTLSGLVKYKHAVKKKENCKITLECNASLHSYHTVAFSGQKKKNLLSYYNMYRMNQSSNRKAYASGVHLFLYNPLHRCRSRSLLSHSFSRILHKAELPCA